MLRRWPPGAGPACGASPLDPANDGLAAAWPTRSLPAVGCAVAQYRIAAQRCMLGYPAGHPLAPHPKRRSFHLPPHQRDHGRLVQPKLRFDRVEGGPVFPGHFNNAGDVRVAERGQTWVRATHLAAAAAAPARRSGRPTLRPGSDAALQTAVAVALAVVRHAVASRRGRLRCAVQGRPSVARCSRHHPHRAGRAAQAGYYREHQPHR